MDQNAQTMNKNIAAMLMQIKAIKLNPHKPFKWASGLYSPIYCDNRLSLSFPRLRTMIAESFVTAAEKHGPVQVIAGVATAGIPHGVLLADRLNLPFVYIRDKAKTHGRNNRIEGEVRGYERVLVIEDLFSTGGSSISAAQVLEDMGCRIAAVMSVFSYELDVLKQNMEDAEYAYSSLTTYNDAIEVAASEKLITQDDLELLKTWRNDPKAWSDNYQARMK